MQILNEFRYGIELETSNHIHQRGRDDLQGRFNCGIVGDGSISGDEYNSPILGGTHVEGWVDEICRYLAKEQQKVDTRCGYHLHISLKEKTDDKAEEIEQLKRILKAYKYFEPVLYGMLPPSRRAGKWCSPVGLSYEEIENIHDERSIMRYYYRAKRLDGKKIDDIKSSKGNEFRYYNLNLHSYFYRGSIEIRSHSGTLNPTKIKNWIYINTIIIKSAINNSLQISNSYETLDRSMLGTRQIALTNLISKELPHQEASELCEYISLRIQKFSPAIEEEAMTCEITPAKITIIRNVLIRPEDTNWESLRNVIVFENNGELVEFLNGLNELKLYHKERWELNGDCIIENGNPEFVNSLKSEVNKIVTLQLVNNSGYSAV
jgi:hypothetical protein